jgi:chitinase
VARGITTQKLVLGMLVYGQSFEDKTGLGQKFTPVAPGSSGAVSYDFKALPLSGTVEIHNQSTGSSYSYDTKVT